ncbi:MAG TPA: hypothetical protein VLA20_02985 [Vicinamibacterales bacterium]|nr:hypothetical protein [Vicinamibacterales bacterium]
MKPAKLHALLSRRQAGDDDNVATRDAERAGKHLDEGRIGGTSDRRRGHTNEQRPAAHAFEG